MKHFTKKISFVFVLLGILASSCVSKKKYQEAMQALRVRNEAVVTDWQNRYNEKRGEVNRADKKIQQLEVNLAERKGENNILLMLRNELQYQIDSLELSMKSMGSSSRSVEQNLQLDIQKKNNEVNTLKQKLGTVNVVLDKNKELFNRISGDLAFEMQSISSSIEVTSRFDQVVLILPEAQLFKRGSSSRITESGEYLIEKISDIFAKYPQLLFQVVGHTDNTPASVKKYKDNWNFSALQAASIVRALVEKYDVNSSQVTIAAKGEFEPRTSNATSEGKRMNRRIEIVIYRPSEDLVKEIKGVTGGF